MTSIHLSSFNPFQSIKNLCSISCQLKYLLQISSSFVCSGELIIISITSVTYFCIVHRK